MMRYLASAYIGAHLANVQEKNPDQVERENTARSAIKSFEKNTFKSFLQQKLLTTIFKPKDSSFQALSEFAGDDRIALALWKRNLQMIIEDDDLGYEYSPDQDYVPLLLDPSSEDVKSFLHYAKQTLAKSKYSIPSWDDRAGSFNPSKGANNSEYLDGASMSKALASLATNYDEVAAMFQGRKEEIKAQLEKGNLIIASNHCTWLNLPIIAAFLHEELGVPLDKINIAIGKAITVYEQGQDITGFVNTFETIPDTPNGRLDKVAPALQKELRSDFLNSFTSQFKEGVGEVALLCPYGTTDEVTTNQIRLLAPSRGSKALLRMLSKRLKTPVWSLATHSGGIYSKQKIREGKFLFSDQGIIHPGDEKDPTETLLAGVEELNPERKVHVLPEALWKGNFAVIGQGKFGSALTSTLKTHFANNSLEVIGLDRQTAQKKPSQPQADTIILATPGSAAKDMKNYIEKNPQAGFILTPKGPDVLRMYQTLDYRSSERTAILSGPNKADQISNGEPSAAILAGTNEDLLKKMHAQMNNPGLRLYISKSPNVIQMSGVLKNLIVLELGKVWATLNHAEKTDILMKSLQAAYSVIKKEAPHNENPEEFWGIAGLGDILLCLEFFNDSTGSRNFQYGTQVGAGEKAREVHADLGTVEGIPTSLEWKCDREWLRTKEMDGLKKDLVRGNFEEAEFIENEHSKLFALAFSELEKICTEKGFNENTRAWAFCRLHKELQQAFPEDCKKEILGSMFAVVLSGYQVNAADVSIPEDIELSKSPILNALKRLTSGESIEDMIIELLDRNTLEEGF